LGSNGAVATLDGFININVAIFSKKVNMLPCGMVLAIATSVGSILVVEGQTLQTVQEWLETASLSRLNDDEQAKVRELPMKYSILFDWSELGPMKAFL
jgi:hypothetical protein